MMVQKFLLDLPNRLDTERLYLRGYQAGDGAWYYAVCRRNRAHLARFEPDHVLLTIQSEAEAEAFVQSCTAAWKMREYFFLGAFDRATDEFVAQVYVGPVNWDLPEFTIGYFVDQEHEGQGYVTEAVRAALKLVFEHLNAHRLRLECDDTNVRSARVAERCGFAIEGHIRQNKVSSNGTPRGTYLYGMLRSEYEAKRP